MKNALGAMGPRLRTSLVVTLVATVVGFITFPLANSTAGNPIPENFQMIFALFFGLIAQLIVAYLTKSFLNNLIAGAIAGLIGVSIFDNPLALMLGVIVTVGSFFLFRRKPGPLSSPQEESVAAEAAPAATRRGPGAVVTTMVEGLGDGSNISNKDLLVMIEEGDETIRDWAKAIMMKRMVAEMPELGQRREVTPQSGPFLSPKKRRQK